MSEPVPSSSAMLSPNVSEALNLKAAGNTLLAAGDYSGAIDSYSEALKLIPAASSGTSDVGEEPSLRSILLSNRSHAYLSSGRVDKALEDAESCIAMEPTWPKAHIRRATALQKKGNRYRRNALDAYDDALAAAKLCKSSSGTSMTIKDIKKARKQCKHDLRETGSSQLSKEVERFGCLLAVPESASITESRCLAATLCPATYDGVDDRTNTPIHATFPGEAAGWPMFVPTITYKATQERHTFPLCYYIIGPCILTRACSKEIDDIFRPSPNHACRWPGGESTRTCPFCAGACVPGRGGETFTMVVHLLMGTANRGYGNKLMMQLVCERGTRKRLLRAKHRDDGIGDERAKEMQMFFDNGRSGGESGVDPMSRHRMLTDGSHAIKTSSLWNRASNTGLISSITIHATDRFQRMLALGGLAVKKEHNTGARNSVAEAKGTETFFDDWMARLDERAIHIDYEDTSFGDGTSAINYSAHIKNQMSRPDCGCSVGNQQFHIRQVARIKDLRHALNRFWDRHGADFRLQWSTWDTEEQQSFAFETGRVFVESRVEHYNRRHTQYHHVQDPRLLVNKPLGNIPKDKLSFLPELTDSAKLDKECDLLQLFRDRITCSKTWVAEDVALVAKLKNEDLLPKLQYNEKDGSYLCDYMGLEDPSIGPFVVLVGEREAEYNSTGKMSDERFMHPEQVVKLAEYRSLQEPFLENITILNAAADGPVRSALNNLLSSGAATCSVSYIYAALRQMLLLEYLQTAAEHYCVYAGKDDQLEMERWNYQGTAGCFVCAARTKPDGSKLLCCSKCRSVSYCSPECQKKDWKRHKAESCVTSPNFVSRDGQPKPPEQKRSQIQKKLKSKKKGKKKGKGKRN